MLIKNVHRTDINKYQILRDRIRSILKGGGGFIPISYKWCPAAI